MNSMVNTACADCRKTPFSCFHFLFFHLFVVQLGDCVLLNLGNVKKLNVKIKCIFKVSTACMF